MPPTITFTSKHRNLRITRRPHVEVATATGAYRTVEHPIRYTFQDRGGAGILEIVEGQDLLPDGAPLVDEDGYAVRDAHGNPRFEMQDALTYLRSLPEYNQHEVIGGFTEVGREPDRIPHAGPTVREIIAAMAQLDVETLRRLAAEEAAASYTRDAVDAALVEAFTHVEAALGHLGQQGGGEAAGTAGNGEEGGSAPEGLDAMSMAELKEVGGPLGLSFPPGTSKVQAREMIREAIPDQPAVAA